MAKRKGSKTKRPIKSEDSGCSSDESKVKKAKRSHVTVKDEGGDEPMPEIVNTDNQVPNWLPENWPEAYENIKAMMEGIVAPLESMPWYMEHDPKKTKPLERFRILVALMLSSQTKDETTLKVWKKLCADGLSIDWVLAKSSSELSDAIKSVNFRNTKAASILETAEICKKKFKGDTPANIKDLTDLKGVGPKMAYLFLQSCYKKCDGLGVDVHMHRLANKLGWIKQKTKDPEKTRVALEAWLSKDLIYEFNRLIPRFGQMKCTAKNPACRECLNKEICPGAEK